MSAGRKQNTLASLKTINNINMKISVLAFVALFGLAFTSCKKDYTCECKKIYTDTDGDTSTSADGTYTFKDSEARATTRCNDLEGAGTDLGGAYTRECQIQ